MQAPEAPLTTIRGYVAGSWTAENPPVPIASPFDGTTVANVHPSSPNDVDAAVAAAKVAGNDWWARPGHVRARVLNGIADRLEERSDQVADQMTAETGRPRGEARGEVARSLSTLRISAEEATRISGEMVPMDAVEAGAGKIGFTQLSPVGVVAAITPFNAPLNTVCHKLGPALAGGNTMVLKPHHHGAGVAVLLTEICTEAGIPDGCLQIVHGDADIGHRLTTHPDVDFVNFTGSGRVAEQILGQIGIRRSLLELGGNAPTLVHRDADLDRAARMCADAAFGLSGQSCISTQRIYVHNDVYQRFTDLLVSEAKERSQPAGPRQPNGIGPLINEQAATRVESWIRAAVADGARLLCGGTRDYTFVEPTVLADVPDSSAVLCDEVFGPTVAVNPYTELDAALDAANASPWGLKAGIFTDSLEVALRAAARLRFGTVNINAASRARVDQEPSGGVKQSGWGKEGPRYALREMMDVRMIRLSP